VVESEDGVIVIRKSDGSRVPVEKGTFVELINDVDQTIGSVFFEPQAGVIQQIVPGSRDASRYAQLLQRDLRQ
jgi:hypothetical protein